MRGPIINKRDASVTRSQKAAREDARRGNSHRKDPPPKGPQIGPDYNIRATRNIRPMDNIRATSDIHQILQELWLCVVKPILDALRFSDKVSPIPVCRVFIYLLFCKGPSFESISDMVVPNRSPCIPSNPCRWYLH